MLLHVSILLFLLLNSILLYGYFTIYSFTYRQTYGLFSVFGIYKLLSTFMYKGLYGDIFSFLLDKYLGMKWLYHFVIMFNFLRNCLIISQSGCVILQSHRQKILIIIPCILDNTRYSYSHFSYSNRFTVGYYCNFHLHFS
jgi:hypothetical protein